MNTGLKSFLRTFVCMVAAALTVGGSIFENPAHAQGSDESESIFVPESLSPVNSIYVRSQKLVALANDPAPADQFRKSVAISGNTAIVGVPFDDIGRNADQGSAYIYVRNGETWTRQGPKLTASDGEARDNFGFSVDIDGDTVVIGAYLDDIKNLEDDRGSAYVFTRSGSTWTQIKVKNNVKLINRDDYTPGDTWGAEYFGYSVAIDGKRIIVGARDDKTQNDGLSSREGSASIYERSGAFLTKIRRTEGGSLFGTSVGISGNRAIIGAPGFLKGAAFIYTSDGIFEKRLDGVRPSSGFGNAVAIDGNTAVIGTLVSKAYVSEFPWTNRPIELTSSGSYFGNSVSIDGDMLVVGNPNFSSGGGNVSVFRRINDVWTYKAQLFQVPPSTDCFGVSVGVDENRIIGGADCESGRTGAASIFVNVSPRPFDFNGGGVSDISVFRPRIRPRASEWFSTDPITGGGFSAIPFGTSGDKIAPADYDGDGKTDIAVFRPFQGLWFIFNSSTSQVSIVPWGLSGDVPRPNDFDNDGKADVALFRPSTSTWWWINSSNQQTNAVQFGQSGDVPLMADFDGDARGELAVFRPASGIFTWFNLTTSQTSTQSFGQMNDIPTPGDFDGDSKTDIAVFRPSTSESTSESPSEWHRINSSNGQGSVTLFGKRGDIPTVADFDGDGESDIAIFRPSDGAWYIINSSFNDIPGTPQYRFITFGASGDVPVPAAYLP